jgi:hypothetical protein
VGKWHLGLSSTSLWPLARGFDEYYGYEAGHRVHSVHARKC